MLILNTPGHKRAFKFKDLIRIITFIIIVNLLQKLIHILSEWNLTLNLDRLYNKASRKCDVQHNDDSILPVLSFLVDNPTSQNRK